MGNWLFIDKSYTTENRDTLDFFKKWPILDRDESIQIDPNQDFIQEVWEKLQKEWLYNFDIDTYNYIAQNVLLKLNKKYWDNKWAIIFNKYLEYIIIKVIKEFNNAFVDWDYTVFCNGIEDILLTKEEKKKTEEEKKKTEEEKKKIEEEKKKIEEENKQEEIIKLKKQKLDDLYKNNIIDKFKWSSEELVVFQKKIIKEYSIKWVDIIWKLNKNKFDVTSYFKYLFTAQKLLEDNEAPIENKYEFIKSFNDLNKSLDIDIQLEMEAYFADQKKKFKIDTFAKKQSISLVDIAEWERILDNKEFQKFKNSQKHNIENIDLGKNKKSILELYSNDKKNLTQIIDYINDDWSINEQKIDEIIKNPDEKSKIIKNLNSQIKESLERYQQDLQVITEQKIKERIISNCVKSVSNIFNQTTENMENFAKDFKIDTDSWVNFNSENQEVYIKWNINWKHVWLYYNISTWIVEMDDFMWYDSNENWWTYIMWKENGKREKLKFNLPTYNQLLNETKNVDFSQIIDYSRNILDYKENLWSKLDEKISSQFKNKSILQYYVEKFNEKNIAEQTVLEDIFSSWGNYDKSIVDFDKKTLISKDLNQNWYSLMEIIFNTLEWNTRTMENKMDADNLRRFRNCINKFNMIINTNQVRNWESEEPLLSLFDEKNMKDSAKNFKGWWDLNYLDFFNLISKWEWENKVIDLNLFESILNIVDKKEEIKWNPELSKYHIFKDKYDKFASDFIDVHLSKKVKSL